MQQRGKGTGDEETNLNSTQLFSCKVNQSCLYAGYMDSQWRCVTFSWERGECKQFSYRQMYSDNMISTLVNKQVDILIGLL